MIKRMCVLAPIAVIALMATGCGSDSSDSSSEWSDSDAASLESELSAETLLTMEEAECVVDKAQSEFPPSVVDSMSDAQREELEKFISECGGDSSDSEAGSGDLYGGSACQDDLESSACATEVEEKTGSAIEQGEERLEEEQGEDQEEFENEEGIYE